MFNARQSLIRKNPAAATETQKQDVERAKDKLVIDVKSMNAALDLIEEARVAWWNTDQKKKQRREWWEMGQSDKLGRLNAVNNRCDEMVAEMRALLGRFGKWTLGVEGILDD